MSLATTFLLLIGIAQALLVSSSSPGLKGFCFAGSDALCSCDELIRRGFIYSYNDCTLAAQVVYCQEYGPCWYLRGSDQPNTDQVGSLANAKDDQCFAGSEALCSCSELIKRGAIDSFDDCTQTAAVDYCKEHGACNQLDRLELE